MLKLIIHITILVLSLSSCDREYIRVYKIPKPTEMIEEKMPKTVQVSNQINLTWNKPFGWEEVAGHSMRLASFNVPYTEGYADLSITSFPGKSGGVAANVNRWLGQIGMEPLDSKSINKIQNLKFGRLGSYKYFKLMGNIDTESAILASIFEIQDNTLFVKCLIPVRFADEIESDFIKFCGTLFVK